METLRLLVIECEPDAPESLAACLRDTSGIRVVARASGADQAVRLAKETQPDVALIALEPRASDGIAATGRIKQVCPNTTIVALLLQSRMISSLDTDRARGQGPSLSGASRELLVLLIHAAYTRGRRSPTATSFLSAGSTPTFPQADAFRASMGSSLSGREQSVLELLVQGCLNRDIARRLSIAEVTAKRHVQSIIAKLGAHNRTEAAAIAVRHSLAS